MSPPLFVCHANCCRSVLAHYLYEHLHPGFAALGAGVEAGEGLNDRAFRMLRHWGVDASAHRPVQLTRELCQRAGGIFDRMVKSTDPTWSELTSKEPVEG